MLPDRSTIVVFLATVAIGFYSKWLAVAFLVVLFLVGIVTAFTLTGVVRKLMPIGMDYLTGKLSLMLLRSFMMQHTTGNTAVAIAPGPDARGGETLRRLKASREIKQLETFIGLLGPLPFFPAYELLNWLESR